jgi:hypothetical protein
METQGTTIDTIMKLECVLTDPERDEAARELAEGIQTLQKYQQQLKQEIIQYRAAQILNVGMRNLELAGEIGTSRGMRDVGCRIHLHHPEPGVKTIIRQDTLEVVETSEMTSDELENHPCEQLTA